jgi:serine/threonine protein kinase
MRIPTGLRWKPTGTTLGEGAQGNVHEVSDQEAPEKGTFALKVLRSTRPSALERFRREIQVLNSISHPHIIRIIDHAPAEASVQYVVTEYPHDSKPLATFLDNSRTPFHGSPITALDFFLQIASALHALEQVSPVIVHRDLSPSNILILSDYRIKIIDFGLCHIEGGEVLSLTDENVGTRNYAAPECEAGSATAPGTYSDLYSAGKLLWSAITSRRAFARERPAFSTHSMEVLFPDAPATWHLHHIFERTIRSNTADRFKTAADAETLALRIRAIVEAGYPALGQLRRRCPTCGYGSPTHFDGSHIVFGNPNPKGITALRCDYCGYCYVVDGDLRNRNLESGRNLQ